MGVRLSEDEAWAELDTAHTGILTTLRRDGRPVSLPVWFATVGRRIYVRTPAKTRKVEHVRNDPRATFLVERGEKWIELCAVMVYADVELLEPGDEFDAASAAITAKYAGFGMESRRSATRRCPTRPRSTTQDGRRCCASPRPSASSPGTTRGCGSRERPRLGLRRRRLPRRLHHRHLACVRSPARSSSSCGRRARSSCSGAPAGATTRGGGRSTSGSTT